MSETHYKFGSSNLPVLEVNGRRIQPLCYFQGKCGLWENVRHVCVPGAGATHPKLLLVGEAPGPREDQDNEPFCGPAGGTLRGALKSAKIPGKHIRVTNVVRCMPSDGRGGFRKPNKKEMKTCSFYLRGEITEAEPTVIVPLGNVPTDWFLGVGKISQRRGHRYTWADASGKEYTVVPSWHPSYILRQGTGGSRAHAELVHDLQVAYGLATGEAFVEKETPDTKINVRRLTLEELGTWIDETIRMHKAGRVPYFSYDLETTAPTHKLATQAYHPDAYIIMLSMCREAGEAVVYVRDHPELRHDPDFEVPDQVPLRGMLRRLLSKVPVVGHGIKYDLRWNRAKLGIDPPKKIRLDTMLAAYLYSGKGELGLDDLARRHLGYGPWDTDLRRELAQYPSTQQTFGKVPLDILIPYSGKDAEANWRLVPFIEAEVDKWANMRSALSILQDTVVTLVRVEHHGNRVDVKERERLVATYGQRSTALLRELQLSRAGKEACLKLGRPFRLTADADVRVFLFDCLGLPAEEVSHPTDSGKDWSVDDATLLECISWGRMHGRKKAAVLVEKLRLARKLNNMISKFFKGLARYMHDELGTVNIEYHLTSQVTGRISTRDPSVQVLAKGSDARRIMISKWSEQGGLILARDASQSELRVLAARSKDKFLRDAFLADKDIHAEFTARIYGMTLDEVKNTPLGKQRRGQVKSVVFALIYGSSAFGLSQSTPLSEEEAAELIQDVFTQAPGVKRYIDRQHRLAREHGHILACTGYLFHFPNANADEPRLQAESMRQAQNWEIQNASSIVNMDTGVKLQGAFEEADLKSMWYSFIHDELLMDVHPGELHRVWELSEQAQQEVPKRFPWLKGVPWKMGGAIGRRWDGSLEIKKYDPTTRQWALSGPTRFYEEVDWALEQAYGSRGYSLTTTRTWEEEAAELLDRAKGAAYQGDVGVGRCEALLRIVA